MLYRWFVPTISGLLFATLSFAQKKSSSVVNDSTKTPTSLSPPPKPGEPKPYNEVITSSATTQRGFLSIHKVADRWFVEIADTLFGRDILIVNRIAKSAADGRGPGAMEGYAGDITNEQVVRFERGPYTKMWLKKISYTEFSSDSSANGMYRSVQNNTVQPIVGAFEIKAFNPDSSGVVLDWTDVLNSESDLFYFDGPSKARFGLTQYLVDRSYLKNVIPYPKNIEVTAVKTYGKGSTAATYELNSSMVLLPKVPMDARAADDRVGYFAAVYKDFDADPQGVKQTEMITRFRLEPKDEDKEKYLGGELVEPKDPIIYYIDPSTPKKWVPYLIQGVNDWQVAFEQAGFKNAIIAKEASIQDSTWSLEDATHNAIVYKPSDVPNASGPHVHDPRSGEIIETHINWYHNVMRLLKNWYTVQAGVLDVRSHQPLLPDSLMGELIRFVSSHEVGHTLGLRHNFGSSSTVPVDSLRSQTFTEMNGHTPSIMDYARFNYVAQPEDHISQAGVFPRIGDYDKWAIEYGYRWWPSLPKTEENQKLNQWITSKLSKNKRLWFGTETDGDDPRCQSEDLGDNAMKASTWGIRNLQCIIPHILEWSTVNGEAYTKATELYSEVIMQYGRYMGHVVKNIGGIMTNPSVVGDGNVVKVWTPKATQEEAMAFLQRQLFTTPMWLLDKNIFAKTGGGSMLTIGRQQEVILGRITSTNSLIKLLRWESIEPTKAYTVATMLGQLQDGIFSELNTGKAISIFRRNLQKMYLSKLIASLSPNPVPLVPGAPQEADFINTDIPSIAKSKLAALKGLIQKDIPLVHDGATKAHLLDLTDRISVALDQKKAR